MTSFTKFALSALVAVTGVSAQDSTTQCAPGLKMFVARGTGEPMGLGGTSKLVEVIASQIPGSDIQAIQYPASMENPSYFMSVANGTMLVKQAITSYAKACPNSKMALFGYSQGAQIITNNLCGMPTIWAAYSLLASPQTGNATGGSDSEIDLNTFLEMKKPLPRQITQNIASIMLFGDPTHSVNASYAFGNSTGGTGTGTFHRGDISECEALGPRIRSYCDAGDPFCDEGGSSPVSMTVHGRYLAVYGVELARVVVGQFRNGARAASNGTGGGVSKPQSTLFPVVTSAAAAVPSAPLFALGAAFLVGML